MKTTITKKLLAELTLPADKKELEVRDSDTAGLVLRLRRNAAGVSWNWYLAYQIEGRDQRDHLGKFSDLTLDDARSTVQDRRRELTKGVNPRDTAKTLKAQLTTQPTLAEATTSYLGRLVCRLSTRRAHVRYLRGPYFKKLHALSIDRITQGQIAECINFIEDKGVEGGKPSANAASQARGSLSEVYRFAIHEEWCKENRAALTRDPAPPCKHVERDRVLTDAELVEVWNAAPALVRLLILTGCRREEVGGLAWSEIDKDTWTLPAERNKIGQVRRIPLSPAVKAILAGIEAVPGRDRVFPNLAWSYIKAKLPALDEPWTFHDLRRTFRTNIEEVLDVSEALAERCIGHGKKKIVRTYSKGDRLEDQRAVFERWAAHVEGLIAASSDVTSIRSA